MLKFYLWNVPGISLLIPAASGIVYANQTGGYNCHQQELEAWLLPLDNTLESNQAKKLWEYFYQGKWSGWCGQGIDTETADYVDHVLQATPHTDWLRVDRARLADSHEAWIYVEPAKFDDTETIEFHGYEFRSGIITWANSD